MDLEMIILSKSETERQIPCDITYTWDLKHDTNEHAYETEADSQISRTDLWLPRGRETREEWVVSLGLADANRYRMHKQQGPTIEHSELDSIPYDKP